MSRRKMVNETEEPYDAIVVGSGICGVIFMKVALNAGLHCLALEKQDTTGGLWNWIPAWQEIQNRKQDFAIDKIPLKGVKQQDVVRMVHEWVEKYNLAPFIRLNHEVTSVSRNDREWQVQTNRGTFHSRYIIVASGIQNEPWLPEVKRINPEVSETHSSALRRPEDLADQRVTVVGGGASAWDLLDLAVENGAKEIHWVYRNLRWFIPTSRTKQTVWPNLREMALLQTLIGSLDPVNAIFRWRLNRLFNRFHLKEIVPPEPMDLHKHQLIPGRTVTIRHLDKIVRHHSKIREIRGRKVILDNRERFQTDKVLWGTGYRINLKYLGLPEYRQVNTVDELRPKLGSFIRSLDYPDLFFVGMSLIDSTGSTPFFTAIESRSIVSHIRGRCDIPMKHIPENIVHWDLFRYFARFDHESYPRFWWKIKYYLQVFWYLILHNRLVRI